LVSSRWIYRRACLGLCRGVPSFEGVRNGACDCHLSRPRLRGGLCGRRGAFARGTIGFAASCGLLALQYLYSLSFLELWTLAEGSYSLQILLRVSRQASISRGEILASCEAIGADKKRNRLDDLQSLRLIAEAPDGTFKLSAMGRMLVDMLSLIMRLTTIREAG